TPGVPPALWRWCFSRPPPARRWPPLCASVLFPPRNRITSGGPGAGNRGWEGIPYHLAGMAAFAGRPCGTDQMIASSYKLTAMLFGTGVTLHNLEEAMFLVDWSCRHWLKFAPPWSTRGYPVLGITFRTLVRDPPRG